VSVLAKSGRIANQDQLDDTIETIYEAALDTALWDGALRKITAAFGSAATLLVRARATPDIEFAWIQEYVPAVEGRWDHYMAYRDMDIRTAYALRKPAPAVYVDQEFIDDRGMDRHPFYQEFMAVHGVYHTVGGRFAADEGQVGLINVFRSKAQGHHEQAEIALMRALLPHLTRVSAIDQRLASARRAQARLRDALDRVPDAIFLVERDGRIVDANRAAERLLRERDGLAAPQAHLTASHAASRRLLADAIAGAAAHRARADAASTVPLLRSSGARPLQALLMPLPPAKRGAIEVTGSVRPLVMVVVSDPEALPAPLSERLAVLWALTPAESRLAAALAAGESVRVYAEQHGLAESTVRWTLKRLLAKTDCRRQPEMVRLLATAATFW